MGGGVSLLRSRRRFNGVAQYVAGCQQDHIAHKMVGLLCNKRRRELATGPRALLHLIQVPDALVAHIPPRLQRLLRRPQTAVSSGFDNHLGRLAGLLSRSRLHRRVYLYAAPTAAATTPTIGSQRRMERCWAGAQTGAETKHINHRHNIKAGSCPHTHRRLMQISYRGTSIWGKAPPYIIIGVIDQRVISRNAENRRIARCVTKPRTHGPGVDEFSF